MKKITVVAAIAMLWFSYQKINSIISDEPMTELSEVSSKTSLYNYYSTAELFIKSHESLSLKPYKCPGGAWTIGWGHVLTKHERRMYKYGITVEKADELFAEDFEQFIQTTKKRFPELTDHKKIMMTAAIAYNIGPSFINDNLGKAIRKGRNIKRHLLRYKFANGRVLKGLLNRRKEELKLWNSSDEEYLKAADDLELIIEEKIKQAYREV